MFTKKLLRRLLWSLASSFTSIFLDPFSLFLRETCKYPRHVLTRHGVPASLRGVKGGLRIDLGGDTMRTLRPIFYRARVPHLVPIKCAALDFNAPRSRGGDFLMIRKNKHYRGLTFVPIACLILRAHQDNLHDPYIIGLRARAGAERIIPGNAAKIRSRRGWRLSPAHRNSLN